jgi:hypothetical protein
VCIEPGDVKRLKDFEKSPEAKALFAIDSTAGSRHTRD